MFAKDKNTYSLLGYNLPLLIAFLLPFGINTSVIILLWVICFFLFQEFKTSIKNIFSNKWSYVLITFFLIHAIGYFFSDNKTLALTAIERKLTFFAFPFLFFSSNYSSINVKKVIISFVSGSFLVIMICLFRAFYLYLFQGYNSFFYSEFAYFMHPSYMAMYLIQSQLIIMIFYKEWLGHLKNLNFKIGFMSLVFIVGIFLCSSKMGLITAVLLLPTTLIVILYHKGFKKSIIGLLITLIVALPVSYKLFPNPYARLKVAATVATSPNEINKEEVESTAVRILIWKEAINIIKNNFVFGVTPGDENDVLCKAYRDNGLTGALNKQLNAHNQYLQTFIATGVIGFLLLCMMTFGALIYGFIRKNYLLVLFSCMAILNFMVESILQSQAGFVFFVFFFCILVRYNLSKLSSNNS